jgi:hypothetical protein
MFAPATPQFIPRNAPAITRVSHRNATKITQAYPCTIRMKCMLSIGRSSRIEPTICRELHQNREYGMPGFRFNEMDTSSWGEQDWRRARIWNLCFLVGWTLFFATMLPQMHWILFIPMLALAVLGGISQVKWLMQISKWLRTDNDSE